METNQNQKKYLYRCPYCGKPVFTELERRNGEMKSLSGQNIALRCKYCHAEAKPRMKPAAWAIQGLFIGLGICSIAAFLIISNVAGIDLSQWAVAWMIGSVALMLLCLPFRRPFMRITRKGSFEDTRYECQKISGNDPCFDLYGVLQGSCKGVEFRVVILEKHFGKISCRLIPSGEENSEIRVGDEIVLQEHPGNEVRIRVTAISEKVPSDR